METSSRDIKRPLGSHPPTGPVGTDLPNFVPALVQNLPILCTILVGVEGLLFVTIGAARDLPRDLITFYPAIFVDSLMIKLPLRDTILLISFICLIAYIAAGYFAVLAQMNDMRAAVREGRVDSKAPGYEARLARANHEQRRQIDRSRVLFNVGSMIFPLSLIVLLDDRTLSVMWIIYLILLIIWGVRSVLRRGDRQEAG